MNMATAHPAAGQDVYKRQTKNNSIAAYPQASIQWILIFFMFIAGINFSLHAQALRGVVKVYLRDRECRFYTVLLILGSAAVSYTHLCV